MQRHASSPGAGKRSWLDARPFLVDRLPDNAEFRVSVCLRLRLDPCGRAGYPCRHVSAAGAQCPCFLDANCDHAIDCGIGGFWQIRHDEPRDILGAELKACGFKGVRAEVVVPEWERDHPSKPGTRQAAVLDLGLLSPPHNATEFVDFHVYHVFSGDGSRAKLAEHGQHEALKDNRYPCRTERGTRAVPFSLVPFVFNAYGGLGTRGQEALKRWHAAAPRAGLLGTDLLPQLALAVTKRVAGQVLGAAIGRGMRRHSGAGTR